MEEDARVIHDKLHPPENGSIDETLRQLGHEIASGRYDE
jgi:hypothetical protein